MIHIDQYRFGSAAFTTDASVLFLGTGTQNIREVDNAAFNPSTAFSVFAWVNTVNISALPPMMSQWLATGNQRGWGMSHGTAGNADKLRVVVSSNGTSTASTLKVYRSSIAINDGNWHHVGFTWGASTLKLYIDGAEDTLVTKVFDGSFASIHHSTDDLYFAYNPNFTANRWAGNMALPTMWQSTLSAGDVTTLYGGGTPTDPLLTGSPTSHWRFNTVDDLESVNGVIDQVGSNDATATSPPMTNIANIDLVNFPP